MSNPASPAMTVAKRPRKRVRLPAQVRAERILASALAEFSRHGYAATRMEDIAHGAGLSKAGVYAHFDGKEAIFQALLTGMLAPNPEQESHRAAEVGLNEFEGRVRESVDAFIEATYARLSDPSVLATLRLLIAESARVPHLIRQWRNSVLQPYLDRQEQRLVEAVHGGHLRRNALTENYVLAHAPGVVAALTMLVYGVDAAHDDIESIKNAHRRMLIELLQQP